MGVHLQRAIVLCQQSRHDLAERELRQELAQDPDNAMAHAFLALCLVEGEKLPEATEEASAAITLAPDLPFAHYVIGRTLHGQGKLKEAAAAAEEAIRLNSTDADHFALMAGIRLDQGRKLKAYEIAEEGLCPGSRERRLRQPPHHGAGSVGPQAGGQRHTRGCPGQGPR